MPCAARTCTASLGCSDSPISCTIFSRGFFLWRSLIVSASSVPRHQLLPQHICIHYVTNGSRSTFASTTRWFCSLERSPLVADSTCRSLLAHELSPSACLPSAGHTTLINHFPPEHRPSCPALALVFSPRCSWRAPRRARRPRPAAPPQTGPAGSAGRRPPQVFPAGAAGAVPPLRPPPKIPGRRRLGCPPAPACAGTSGARLRPAPCQAPGAVAGGPRGAAGLGGASAALREARRGAVGAALC